MSATPNPSPLAGVRVLDLVDGPLQGVGRTLAELGAEVVRVEPPGGSPDRHAGVVDGAVGLTFAVRNAGKRLVELDPADADVLRRTAARADVVLVSTASTPYDVAALRSAREQQPRLVVLELTDFGRTGPQRDWLATPQVHFALSSVLSRSGLPEVARPLLPPPFLAYEAAAAQAAWVAVLAHHQSRRTGVGDDVDFSVSEAIMQILDPGMGVGGSARAGAPMRTLPRGRPDARHLYPIFAVRDGWVRICVLSPRQWRSMFTWLGEPAAFADPRLASLGARFAVADTLYPAIGALLAPLTRDEAAAAGHAAGVPVAGLASVTEVLGSEAFAAAGALRGVELSDGRTARVPTGCFEIDGRRCAPDHLASDAAPAARPSGDVFRSPRIPCPAPTAAPGSRPFAGLRVLDLGVIVVGAELSRLFGDYGADVIKVESTAFPDGLRQTWDGSEITEGFAWGHRNKRSLGLNLKHDEGRRIFGELVARSDVVLTNFKPGTLESLGFGWERLAELNPRIVLSESSAFGRTGPWSGRLGYGPLVRASTGLSALWRYPELEGSFSDAITIFPDHVVARLNAAAVAALLLRRDVTGRGGRVSTAQVDAIFAAMADLLALESLHPGSIDAPGGIGAGATTAGLFAAAGDDEWVVVDAHTDEQLARLATVIGAEPTEDAVAAWVAQRPPREAAETLQAGGVPAGNLVRVTDFTADPHLRARGFFGELHQPQIVEAMPTMMSEARFSSLPPPLLAPAPLLAEHTAQVMHEVLGLSPSAVAALVDDGALELHPSTRPAVTPT